MRPRTILSVLSAVACLGTATSLHAATLRPVSLPGMVAKADLIAEGRVIAINHRNSDVIEPDDAAMPHTFVTYAIERTAKGGSSAGDTITLRFLGGPDGQGRALLVGGMPQFRVGDRDLLFVHENGTALCPLLGWEQGRLRIVRGAVYDDLGSEVWISPQGNVVRGPRRIDVRAEGYPQISATDTADDGPTVFAPPAGSARPDPAGMHAIVEFLLVAARRQGQAVDGKLAQSQDPGALLRVPRFVPSKPPAEPPMRATRRVREPGDER